MTADAIGDPMDAEARGSVAVAALPLEYRPMALDLSEDALPDLLASVVPVGENPTDTTPDVDALGNPIGDAPEPTVTRGTPAPAPQPEPTAPPLDRSLTRTSAHGPIPGPNAAGRTPLQAYRAAHSSADTRKPVSLIIGGLGINPALTRRAIRELPAAVTLSFAAQSPDLQRWMDSARAYGHEVLLEVPMEGDGSAETEDRLIRTDAAPEENRDTLHALLAKAQGYVGITPYQGARVLRRADTLGPVLSEVSASGLAFFTDGSADAPTLGPMAQSLGLPHRAGNLIIDPSPDTSQIITNLNRLSETASDEDSIQMGVGFAYPQTLDAVKGWAATLSQDGLYLAPATATLAQ